MTLDKVLYPISRDGSLSVLVPCTNIQASGSSPTKYSECDIISDSMNLSAVNIQEKINEQDLS